MQTPLVRYMLRPHQNLLLIRCSSASVVPVPRRQIRLLSSSRPSRRSRKKSIEDPSSPSPAPQPRMASQRTVADVLMGAARAAAEKKAKKSAQAPDAVPVQPLKKSKTRDSQKVTDATLLKEEKEEKNLELEPRKKGFGLDPESVSSLKDGESIPSILMGAARVAAEKKAKKSTQARDAVPAQPSKKSKTRDHQNVTDATLVKEEKEEKNLELEPRKKGSGFDPCKDAESIPPVLMGPAGAAAEKKAKKSTQAPDAVPAQPLKKSKTRDRQNVTDATLLKEVKEEKNLELEPRKKGSGFDPKFVSSCKDAESIPPVLMGAARAAAEKKAKKSTQAPDAVPAQSLKKSKTRDSQNVTDATLLKEEKVEKNLELEPRKKESGFDPWSVSSCKDAESIPSVLMGAARAAAEKKEKKSTQAPDAVPAQPLKKSKTRDRQNVTDATLLKEEKKEKNLELELRKKGSGFDPKSVASWKDGESIPFLFIARALDLISNESGRIAIADILTNVFRTVIATTPGDLVSVVYLSANKIAPPHEGLELGIGDATIIRALAEAYGRKEEHVKNQLKELGDLGLVAKASRLSQRVMFKPKPLTVSKVLDTFRSIAKESGKDSQDKKRNHIKGLLVAATDCEPQYLIRLLQSKMRIGLAEQTVLISLGQAAVYCDKSLTASMESSHEEAAKIVKQVYSVLPDYDKIIPNLLHVGVWKLPEVCKFSLGVPVKPMLAKPTKGVSEILDKFQGIEFTCEYKYDGERAQIHCMEDGSIEIYSRNAERNTGKFPDVVASVSRFKKPSVKSFVLDCEVVAYDREKQKILPFQILSTRARKDVAMSDIKVEVCTFAFDLLFLNGEDLLQQQLKDRRQHLYDSFEEIPGYFQFATALTSTDLEEIQKFLQSAMDASCEGLIIKTLDGDATYEPSRRSNNWLKLKKDYMDSIGDSLDLVPIAAFHGRGKRTGVYGSFLLACYDEQNEEYQSICNIGTGFSEKDLEERSSSLRSRVIPKPKPYYRFGESLNPDVWFEPAEVWEVKAADLSISPVHRAAHGAVDPIKGISLRFPRLLRIRDDKNPEQATTAEQVAELYRAQKFNHVNNLTEDNDD